MVAGDLISSAIPALSFKQTGSDAFHQMGEFNLKHLPIVHEDKLVGIISEEDIFNNGLYESLKNYDFSHLRHYSVQLTDHIFTIIRVMGENRLTIVPVENEVGNFVGIIAQNELLQYFAQTTSFAGPGGVIVLNMQRSDYSLGALARIVEQEDVHIFNAMITSSPEDDLLEVTLKLGTDDLSRVAASFERHSYQVKEVFSKGSYNEKIQTRYDALIRYLEV